MKELMDKKIGQEVLLELADILDGMNIPFFLIQGTALGAYRNKGFVPTELDIDFGFLAEDFVERIPGLRDKLEKQYWYTVAVMDDPFKFPRTLVAAKKGVKADLVGYFRWKGWRFTHSRTVIGRPYAIGHSASLLETYEELILFGRKFKVPSPIIEYLRREYDKWREPREDHYSRTRVYGFIENEEIPDEFFVTVPGRHKGTAG